MNSINFATYFRPKTFSEVVGQDVPKEVLTKIALTPGISVRSIFLKGAFGAGKTTISKLFGRAVNCSNFSKLHDVCNECDHCKEASTLNSQLYMELDSSIVGNVDAIRSLQEKLSYIPNGRRVVVFDETHAVSKAGQNALLKMVEEGVPNTFFVFASTEDILPTIKSRSICLEITTIPHNLIVSRLQTICDSNSIPYTPEALDSIASKSNGHMRDALSILQLYTLVGDVALKTSYQLIIRFFKAALSKRLDIANSTLQDILQFPSLDIRNSLYLFIRNAFSSQPNTPLYPFLQSGWINKIYSYVFSPVSQSALKDEVGIELMFKSFLDKLSK